MSWLEGAKKASNEANRLWIDQAASTADMAKGGIIGLIINDNHPRALGLLERAVNLLDEVQCVDGIRPHLSRDWYERMEAIFRDSHGLYTLRGSPDDVAW
jgi:hypothetical protein